MANVQLKSITFPGLENVYTIPASVDRVEVTGSTPSITAQADKRYICSTVTSISITPPESGMCDVVFTSGSTAAQLTIPNTVMLPGWFDPDSLEANTVYEINILDGLYGTVMTWQTS